MGNTESLEKFSLSEGPARAFTPRGGTSRGERTPLRTRWDPHADPGALFGRALDPKRTTQARDALAHRLQAEVPRERARRVEALAIVPNFQEDLAPVLLQPQLHAPGLGVLDRVVQSLLGDAIDRLFYL